MNGEFSRVYVKILCLSARNNEKRNKEYDIKGIVKATMRKDI